MREDTLFYPLMIELAACLERELNEAGLAAPCTTSVLPGSIAAVDCGCEDGGCDGQGWVLVTNVFPTVDFPIQEVTAAHCGTRLAASLQVGVSRCTPVFANDQGDLPTTSMLVEATRLQMADMAAMHRAINCCVGKYADLDFVLGSYQPIDPQGGCGGGVWSLTVAQG